MQHIRNILKAVPPIPEDWRPALGQFLQISYSLFSIPFTWTQWVDGGRVGVTVNKLRLSIIFCTLTVSSLDCVYRSLVCTLVDYNPMTSQQVMQMYSEYISRTGCTILGWVVVLRRQEFACLTNNLLKKDERMKSK